METRYIFAKKTKVRVEREVREDGTAYLHVYNLDGTPHRNASALIGNYGGVDGCWAATISKEEFDERIRRYQEANSPERKNMQEVRAAARRLAIEESRSIAFRDLVAQGSPIPTTYENISIVLRYLNTMNWGGWELPAMSIGYRCNQYDCDGKQASTMILDEPILVDGVMVSKFVVGAPIGHLNYYHRC